MRYVNQVLTGDCREVLKQLPTESIAACITDPPYNYEFIGHKWSDEEINRRTERIKNSSTLVKNIPYGSGLAGGVRTKRWYEKNRKNILEYEEWCLEWGKEVYRVCKPGAFTAVFNSTRTLAHVQTALEKAGFYARDCLVYRRHSGIPKGYNAEAQLKGKGVKDYSKWSGWHSCLRNEWEGIVVVQKPLIDNYTKTVIEYGISLMHAENPDGSFQSNILEGIPRDKKDDSFNVHCTVKPLALMEKLIDLFVPPGNKNIVLDPFAGSGTTLVAAQNLSRPYIGIEVVPAYVEIIKRRLMPSEDQSVSVESNSPQLELINIA